MLPFPDTCDCIYLRVAASVSECLYVDRVTGSAWGFLFCTMTCVQLMPSVCKYRCPCDHIIRTGACRDCHRHTRTYTILCSWRRVLRDASVSLKSEAFPACVCTSTLGTSTLFDLWSRMYTACQQARRAAKMTPSRPSRPSRASS